MSDSAHRIHAVLEALDRAGCAPRQSGRGWQARCPAHEDRSPSLAISEGDEGRVLIHCFADCDVPAIMEALGLQVSDLFDAAETAPHRDSAARHRRAQSKASQRTNSRPPIEDVRAVWDHCRPLDQDREAVTWATSRGLDPYTIADRDLCRALPRDAIVPRWASLGGASWPEGGYRLVLPMYDSHGQQISLHARNVDAAVSPKGALPGGFAARGLVLADHAGLLMLRSSELRGLVWIAEGAPDFLSCGTGWGDAAEDLAPAVLGILGGSWTPEIAARIPDGAHVVLSVHHDAAGEKYLSAIAESLADRCNLERWSPRVEI